MSISIFCCGGTGVNIGKQIPTSNMQLDVYYIDTSKSNLKGITEDNIFIVEEMDGAGKYRAMTYDKFKSFQDEILIRFKPSDTLNIVLSSLSGGSGSVIAPLVAKELISNGYNTIVIGIDSRNSVIELRNTIKTLQSYRGISSTLKKPVSLYYIENHSRKEADEQALLFIQLFSVLTNKAITEEFDISDLANFINFDKVTDNEPTVSIIDINRNEEITPLKGTSVVSTILLSKDKNTKIFPVIPEYLAHCIVTDVNYTNDDMRIDNIIGLLGIILNDIESQVKQLEDKKQINKVKDIEVQPTNSDGLVI